VFGLLLLLMLVMMILLVAPDVDTVALSVVVAAALTKSCISYFYN